MSRVILYLLMELVWIIWFIRLSFGDMSALAVQPATHGVWLLSTGVSLLFAVVIIYLLVDVVREYRREREK